MSYNEISEEIYGKNFELLGKKDRNKIKAIYNKRKAERIKLRSEKRILGKNY